MVFVYLAAIAAACFFLAWVISRIQKAFGLEVDGPEHRPKATERSSALSLKRGQPDSYSDVFDRYELDENRPEGESVNWNWPWLEVAGTQHRMTEVSTFLTAVSSSSDFSIRLERDPKNAHDPNAIKVIGVLARPSRETMLGYVPAQVAEDIASYPPEMPIAVQLKRAAIVDHAIYVTIAGLMPNVKERRWMGYEETPPKAPSKITLGETEIAELETLIEKLRTRRPLTDEEASQAQRDMTSGLMSRVQAGEAQVSIEQKGFDHLDLPYREHKKLMRQADNDLVKQVGILDGAFDSYFDTGMSEPPNYAERVAIILRKAGRRDLEKAWLETWLRYFPPGSAIGQRYEALAERARKLSA
ncbi:HIRAN domain-containing protein [Histidinibacterium aquaticum]|nr:HIRAN domain-containing protein [Histidinibacterium aquaticum]